MTCRALQRFHRSTAIGRALGAPQIVDVLEIDGEALLQVKLDVAALLAGVRLNLPAAGVRAISGNRELKRGLLLRRAGILIRCHVLHVP
jgi:hypothetical protein